MTSFENIVSQQEYNPHTGEYITKINDDYLRFKFGQRYGVIKNKRVPLCETYLLKILRKLSLLRGLKSKAITQDLIDMYNLYNAHNISFSHLTHGCVIKCVEYILNNRNPKNLKDIYKNPNYEQILELIRKLIIRGTAQPFYDCVDLYTYSDRFEKHFRNIEYLFDVKIKLGYGRDRSPKTADDTFVLQAKTAQLTREKLFTNLEYYAKYATIHLSYPEESYVFQTLGIGDLLNMYHLLKSDNPEFSDLKDIVSAKTDVVEKFEQYIAIFIGEMAINNIPGDIADMILLKYMMVEKMEDFQQK